MVWLSRWMVTSVNSSWAMWAVAPESLATAAGLLVELAGIRLNTGRIESPAENGRSAAAASHRHRNGGDRLKKG